MSDGAKVTSIEALDSFRASLMIYLEKARGALDEVADEVRRARTWLQYDQRTYWDAEAKRRRRAWDEAKNELFRATLATFQEAKSSHQLAVTKTKRALDEAEEKQRILKKWNQAFDSRVDPLAKKLERLRDNLARDMPNAVIFLAQAAKTLDAYTRIGAAGGAPSAGSKQASDDSTEEGTPEEKGDAE
jgi:hypothetical protein